MEQHILKVICNHYGLKMWQLTTKEGVRDTNELVLAKQTAAFFLWGYTRLTAAQIADLLDYQTHNNVTMAKKKVEEVAQGDKAYKDELIELTKLIIRR